MTSHIDKSNSVLMDLVILFVQRNFTKALYLFLHVNWDVEPFIFQITLTISA